MFTHRNTTNTAAHASGDLYTLALEVYLSADEFHEAHVHRGQNGGVEGNHIETSRLVDVLAQDRVQLNTRICDCINIGLFHRRWYFDVDFDMLPRILCS